MNKLQREHEQDKLAHVNKWRLLTADDGFSNRNRYEGGRGFMPHEELVDQHRNKDQQTDRQTDRQVERAVATLIFIGVVGLARQKQWQLSNSAK